MDSPPTLVGIHQAALQLAAARDLRWYPGQIEVSGNEVSLEGWALTAWEPQDQLRFLVNGEDFQELAWPLASADLLPFFGGLPHAAMSRFHCRHRFAAGATVFRDGFARFNVTSRFGEHAMSYRTAWYLPEPAREVALPSGDQIARVIGAPQEYAFRLGGATCVRRFDAYLRQRFDRPIDSFEAVLDWGCGAGRLARYLPALWPRLTGVDIDADNVATCERLMPAARFLPVPLRPPTPLADASFDLVIGLSVLTHLGQAMQDAWLSELRRVMRPGGLALLSVTGLSQSALYGEDVATIVETHRLGFRAAGRNGQLDAVLPGSDYYQDVRHSHDYILSHWNTAFEVLDIVPALAGDQDAVVLRRRAG